MHQAAEASVPLPGQAEEAQEGAGLQAQEDPQGAASAPCVESCQSFD